MNAERSPRLEVRLGRLEGVLAARGLQAAGFVLVVLGVASFVDLAFARGWIDGEYRCAGEALLAFAVLTLWLVRGARPDRSSIARTCARLGSGFAMVAFPLLLARASLIDALSVAGVVLFLESARCGDELLGRAGAVVIALAGALLAWLMAGAGWWAGSEAWQFDLAAALWIGCAFFVVTRLERIVSPDGSLPLECVARAGFDAVTLACITHALDAFMARAWPGGSAAPLLRFVWIAYGAGLFAAGLRGRRPPLRWEALALFAFTICTALHVDLSASGLACRAASLVAAGGVLFAVSAMYRRFVADTPLERAL